jgi:hypothetical protein
MGLGDILDEAQGVAEKLKGAFFQKNVLIGAALAAGLAFLAVLGTVLYVSISHAGDPKKSVDVFVPERIAAEDLFLPNEPDFLPPVILEQEQKKSWRQEDAEPFWTDPLEYGSDYWRDNISETVDSLLERFP